MSDLQNAADWSTLEHLVLDFGGVLYQIDHQATASAFAKLGATDFLEHYAHGQQSPLLDQIEVGGISEDGFLQALLAQCTPGTSMDDVRTAWSAVLIGLRTGIVPVLQDLAKHYDLVLFSNTNALHAAHFERQILAQHGRAFSDAFRQIIYSHRLGYRKPNLQAYRAVSQQFDIRSSRCFFVDDTAINVRAAMEAGWSAALHDPHASSLKEWLRQLGCPIWD